MNDSSRGDAACTVVLIRHGETPWNRIRRIQGHIDIGLSPLGEAQAERLAARLATPGTLPLAAPIEAVYSSDLCRAHRTATPFARLIGLPVQPLRALRERHYGAFEGDDAAGIARRFPEAYRQWQAHDPHFEPPGGESQAAFCRRIVSELDRLAALHAGRTIACVAHGGVLDCAYRHATGLGLGTLRQHALLNASINVLSWGGDAPAVLHWADVSHLQGLDTEDDSLRRSWS